MRASSGGLAWTAPVVLALVGLYLAGQYGLRLVLGGSLGFDDAEQALFAQSFAAGYRLEQPPLYTWLLLASYETFGVSLPVTILPRYLLLAVTFAALYWLARLWIPDRSCAALAIFAYALIYVFAYYAHHDLTHTTALGAGIALTFLAFAWIVHRPASTLAYAALGGAMALGFLGKWNFVMLAAGLPLACLVHSPYRTLVLTWRSLAAALVMVALCLPTGLWVLAQETGSGAVMAETLEASDGGVLMTLLGGTQALLGALILFPMPFLAVVLPLFGRSFVRGWQTAATDSGFSVPPRFLALLIALEVLLHWLLIPLVGAEAFTARWMHPVLMILPIFLFQLVAAAGPDPRPVRAYLALVALAVLLVVGARTARHWLGADHCGKCREMAPFDDLAADLREVGVAPGTIVADGWHLGGNLRLQFPDARIIEARADTAVFPPADQDPAGCLLAWPTGEGAPPAARQRVTARASAELSVPEDAPMRYGEVEALMHGSRSRTYRLGYGYLADGEGDCR